MKKIKTMRNNILKHFLTLLIVQVFSCVLSLQLIDNPMVFLKWQLYWFIVYFSISFVIYIYASKIINLKK